MEKTIINGKMIKEYMGINDGYRVKIKRNSKVYRQKNKGERWEFVGRTARIAYKYAKDHNIKKWRLSSVLDHDSFFHTIETFQKNGFNRARDMENVLKMGLNQCFGDIYRNGKIFILGNSPREPEDAIFFDSTQCEEMAV